MPNEQPPLRTPTTTDFALVNFARNLIADMVVPLSHEGLLLESVVRLVAKEEGLDDNHTAFLIALALGNVTEDNWESTYIPF